MKIYFISFVISILMMAFSSVAIYNITDYMDPPVTPDGHRYMPTENIAKALFLSIIIGAVTFISAIRIQRERGKK
ncbi:hypothetical protein [Chryseobacterium sp. SIMBA_028]|uniref:hypothetical protein n=1 Tax=Chryseobacterium sp. SIMBA_028 TaxID=3085771 RepID=UPI00397988C5